MDWLIGFMGGPENAQALAGIFSAITAGVAVFIAVWNGWITRKNARLSVVPALSVWAEYPNANQPVCKILCSNKGFGPAIVQSIEIFHKSQRVDGFSFEKISNAIKLAFAGTLKKVEYTSSGERGHAFGAGDEITLARFTVSEGLPLCGAETVAAHMKTLTLIVRYKDIYRRDWVFMVHDLNGYSFRESWLNSEYRTHRKNLGRILESPPN